jgi:hypothetical protein
MSMPDNIVQLLANGECSHVDPVGHNAIDARQQAYEILIHWEHEMVPVLIALITKIQQDAKSIEMLTYQTKWRKRRP